LLVPRKDTCSVRVYKFALKQLGVPYKWGGGNCNGPTKGGFDCSGLTKYAVCQATNKQKVLPHSAWQQYKSRKCKHIKYAHRQKGDLVFWSTKSSGKCTKDSSIKHVAVVQNDNYIIVAPKAGQKVKRQKMWSDYGGLYKCNYVVRCC
jgi:cell wall-associated NlpC family hydrolase